MEPLYLRSLRGGVNQTDPPSSLDNDQTTVAQNLDFDQAFLGAKRQGSSILTFSGLNLSGTATGLDAIVGLHRFMPTDDAGDAQLVIEAVTPSGAYGAGAETFNFFFAQEPEGFTTLYAAAVIANSPADAQSLHGKMFLTIAHSGVTAGGIDDRLYVYDPDTTGLTILESGVGNTTFDAIRKTGVWEPAAPTVADEGSGSFTTTRYYRVRGVVQVSGVTTVRSEPSDSVSLAPSGSGAGARVTRPAYMEGTHWEVETSLDDVLFYRLTTVVITTSTYDDEAAAATVGDDATLLSDDIGDYTVMYAARYVAADEDRLLIAGALYQPDLRSRVSWTPVNAAAGVGNDERLENDTDPFTDLDGFDGGAISGMDGPINAFMWVLKDSHIYKLVRTGSRAQAYIALTVTKANGAVPNSLISGLDQSGNAALFFLDPRIGPMLIGTDGLKTMGEDIRQGTWATFNPSAGFPCHGLFYSTRQQVWWWIATAGADSPNLKIVVDVKEFTEDRKGYRKGWGTHTGTVQECKTSVLFADNLRTVASGEAYTKKLKPFFGTVNPIGVTATAGYAQKVGSYTGNGTSQSITGLGWLPKLVLIAPIDLAAAISSNSRGGAFATVDMDDGDSVIRAAAPAVITTGIESLDADGFSVGAHDSVNKSGITYHYVAFYDLNALYLKTGTYTGDGLDARDVVIATGFQPDFLWIMGVDAGASAGGIIRQTDMAGDYSVKLNSSATVTDLIQAMNSNGFELGTAAAVNASGATFYYMAWQDDASLRLAALMKIGKITGTGAGQSVIGVGFLPEWVMSTGPTTFGGVFKTPDM